MRSNVSCFPTCKIRYAFARYIKNLSRGNLAIVGVVLVREVCGAAGLAEGAMFAGAVALLLNVLAVIAFSADGQTSWRDMVWRIFQHPLLINIVAAIIVKRLSLPVPSVVLNFGGHFVGMTLPLALPCTGGIGRLGDGTRHGRQCRDRCQYYCADYRFLYRDYRAGYFFFFMFPHGFKKKQR